MYLLFLLLINLYSISSLKSMEGPTSASFQGEPRTEVGLNKIYLRINKKNLDNMPIKEHFTRAFKKAFAGEEVEHTVGKDKDGFDALILTVQRGKESRILNKFICSSLGMNTFDWLVTHERADSLGTLQGGCFIDTSKEGINRICNLDTDTFEMVIKAKQEMSLAIAQADDNPAAQEDDNTVFLVTPVQLEHSAPLRSSYYPLEWSILSLFNQLKNNLGEVQDPESSLKNTLQMVRDAVSEVPNPHLQNYMVAQQLAECRKIEEIIERQGGSWGAAVLQVAPNKEEFEKILSGEESQQLEEAVVQAGEIRKRNKREWLCDSLEGRLADIIQQHAPVIQALRRSVNLGADRGIWMQRVRAMDSLFIRTRVTPDNSNSNVAEKKDWAGQCCVS